MSTLSEQQHLNPRDPRYYAPRWLRQKTGSQVQQEPEPDTPFSPAGFDSENDRANSGMLRHRLDPEVMQVPEYELEQGGALRSVTVRFAAAVGFAALVALFFVVIVPASRQSDGETAGSGGIVQSIKTALFRSGGSESAPTGTAPKPTVEENHAVVAAAQASPATPPGPSGQLLNQFMQWRQKPNSTTP